MGKFFLKKIFTPVVYVPNDQRVMGIIWRYVRWGTHGPPPPPPPGTPAADLPTHLPPLQTPKSFRTRLGVKIRTGHSPRTEALFGGVSSQGAPMSPPPPQNTKVQTAQI